MEVARDKLRFFKSGADFRKWLESNHASAEFLWVGFHKLDTGRGGITYPEALEEALCYGWIDGIRKRLDESSYTTRFTPRTPRSVWSKVNIAHVKRLIDQGRMRPAGLAEYEKRDPERSGLYSFERASAAFTPAMQKTFRARRKAWEFFQSQPPGYRRLATWWVISAKRPETRNSRLRKLIQDSHGGRRLAPLAPASKRR